MAIDVIYMLIYRGKSYIVVARDDFSGWVEVKVLSNVTSAHVAKFLWEDVICRYGYFGYLIVDGGPENKDLIIEMTTRYGIKRIVILAYHAPANGMIERDYQQIKDALAKMTEP